MVFPCLLSDQASASNSFYPPWDAPGCSNNLSPLLLPQCLWEHKLSAGLEAENVRRREAKLNKLHYSQFPQTFLSSGESICEAFPGPLCWLGLAAPQFPWEQHAYHSSSGNSSLATGKQVTSQEPGSKPLSLSLCSGGARWVAGTRCWEREK